jgi:hypothetical protein
VRTGATSADVALPLASVVQRAVQYEGVEREDEDMKRAFLVFLVVVLALVVALSCTDLAQQYEARDCVTVGKYTHCRN